jgi:peptidoglycan/LPS O-acetylase OafA/YrhL
MTVETWSALVGALLPALVSVVNREDWKSWIKAVIALGSSVLAGTITALLAGDFTGLNWVAAIGIVFGTSQIAYITWWKGSGITKSIENKVNVVPEVQSMKELEHSSDKK